MKAAPSSFLAGLCVLAFSPLSVPSATSTASIAVSATVLASCGISAPAVLPIPRASTVANVKHAVSVNCEHNTQYTVTATEERVISATFKDSTPAVTGLQSRENLQLGNSLSRLKGIPRTNGRRLVTTHDNDSAEIPALEPSFTSERAVVFGDYSDVIAITVTY